VSGQKAFVAGWPVAHSRSPLIHRFWLRRHGIDGDYVPEAVPPDSIDSFLTSFNERGYVGGNVTLPHKYAAFRACGEVTAVAARLGVANTLWIEDGAVHGDNTDVYGFAANLDERAPAWRRGSMALIIGAGGAARAVIHALSETGFDDVVVLNRTLSRAEALARDFGDPVRAGGLDELPHALPKADLIVNATSASLSSGEGVTVDWSAAPADAIATDLVYVPLMTPFLVGAAERGLHTVDGLGMLLHQAAPGFERWYGVRPEVDEELRSHVVANLAR
jgi:shikimate dehydrogenase